VNYNVPCNSQNQAGVKHYTLFWQFTFESCHMYELKINKKNSILI